MKEDRNIWESSSATSPQTKSNVTATTNSHYLDIDIRRVFSVWPYILVLGLAGWWVAKLYLRYVHTVYSVSTSINLQQQQEVSIGQALYGSARDPFNDQIAYFKSPTLATQLVDSLGLQYNSIAKGTFKDKDCYGIIRWSIVQHPKPLQFTLTPQKNGFSVLVDSTTIIGNWGAPMTIKGSTVVINKLDSTIASTPITCTATDVLTAAFKLSKAINIVAAKESNIITLTYSDISNNRAIDILNGLVVLYNQVLKQDKTRSFAQAIDFIEKRMGPLAAELDSIETALAHYKAGKGFIGTSANGAMYQEQMKGYDQELVKIGILKSTIAAIEKFIINPNLKDENLALVGISDGYLQSLLTQYQQLRAERDKLDLVATDNFPNKLLLDKQLTELRNNLFMQVKNYKNNLAITENSYQQKMSAANTLLKNTPHEEKELIDKFRIQNIKEALFLTLLQKREEAAVAQASVTVNTKILIPAAKLTATEKPDRNKIGYIGMAIGMLLPLTFALLRELLNRTIISKKQLTNLSKIPVIAELEQGNHANNNTKAASPFAVSLRERSMIGEQIRSLRTTLAFYQTNPQACTYIMITSSMSGEGKSFLSLNLARSYALQGKRVALLEFDLRRPKMSKTLQVANQRLGLSSVLLGKCQPHEIIQQPLAQEDTTECLHFFPAGLIPPNPQELISGQYMPVLKSYLDAHYDVVIIDTPPYGIVADAQILGAWAHVTLIMVRFNYTLNQQISEVNEWHQKNTFGNMALIFNGIQHTGYYGYRYNNYYYKRKYGYQYYSGNEA